MADMVDVGGKLPVERKATAEGRIILRKETVEAIRDGRVPKGDAVVIAKLTATSAVKDTPSLIPLCHPIPIDGVEVDVELEEEAVIVRVSVSAVARTGVEMEALTGLLVALLNIWDVVKQLEKDETGNYPITRVEGVRVVEKRVRGVPKHHTTSEAIGRKTAVLTVSSTRTVEDDEAGATIERLLREAGLSVVRRVVPDNVEMIRDTALDLLTDSDILISNGGTGIGTSDVTPDALMPLFQRRLSGFESAFTRLSLQQVGSAAILSRATAGIINLKPVFILPGSVAACELALKSLIIPQLPHIFTELSRK